MDRNTMLLIALENPIDWSSIHSFIVLSASEYWLNNVINYASFIDLNLDGHQRKRNSDKLNVLFTSWDLSIIQQMSNINAIYV